MSSTESIRPVIASTLSRPTIEGAGVRLERVFGKVDPHLDPFLLLDDFGSDDPNDYLRGFPWHPHRGIETITYMLAGQVEHRDSLGNQGVIAEGDVQWMTAGSGIIHQEMPLRSELLKGFQLWANLPASNKMMEPRYRDVAAADIPVVEPVDGVEVKVICGRFNEVSGPVSDVVSEPQVLDVHMKPSAALEHAVSRDHNAFSYVYEGDCSFSKEPQTHDAGHLVVLGSGDVVHVSAGKRGARLLLISGKPIGEPVAWGGPIVMNSKQELQQAYRDLEEGTFIKER